MASMKPEKTKIQPAAIEEEIVHRIIKVLQETLNEKKLIHFSSLKNSFGFYILILGLILVSLSLFVVIICDPHWSPFNINMRYKILNAFLLLLWVGIVVCIGSQFLPVLQPKFFYQAANQDTQENVRLYNELILYPKSELEFSVLLFRQYLSREISPLTIMIGDLSKNGFVLMLITAVSSVFALMTKGLGPVFAGIVLGAGIMLAVVMRLAVFANAAVARGTSVADIADYVVSHAYPDKE